jgi:hypothetical protein
MIRRTTATRFGFFAIGISLVVMALSMTSLVGSPPAKAILLGAGMLVLSLSLILLQIRFFREGDARKAEHARQPVPRDEPSAPRQLRNPRQRIIWTGMEGTRALMNRKEEEVRREERRKEKMRLGMSEEEKILYMGDRSWLSLWPLALFSVILAVTSAAVSGVPSLILLCAGLSGLLFLVAVHRLTRYYITNFRVLIRRRSLLVGKSRWRVIYYPDIHRCVMKRTFAYSSLRLEGEGGTVDIQGLSRTEFETACGVLREKTPEKVCLSILKSAGDGFHVKR